jgi:1-acyl-sn-glycerol-3-phosphate acyltransferase
MMTTLLFVAFTIGIGGGALLTTRLLKGQITGQFAPVGLIVLTVFMADLALIADYPPTLLAGVGDDTVFATIVGNPMTWRLLLDLAGIAAAGAVFVVPLYALLQHSAKDEERARIIAASNVIGALFIVIGSAVAAALLALGVSARAIIGVLAAVNVLAAIYAIRLVPTLIVRGVFRSLLTVLFRMRVHGLDRLKQKSGPVVFVANHISYIDGIILAASLPGQPVFAVHTHVADKWWARPFLALVDFKALDPTNPLAIKTLINEVKEGRSIVIFPEAGLPKPVP